MKQYVFESLENSVEGIIKTCRSILSKRIDCCVSFEDDSIVNYEVDLSKMLQLEKSNNYQKLIMNYHPSDMARIEFILHVSDKNVYLFFAENGFLCYLPYRKSI